MLCMLPPANQLPLGKESNRISPAPPLPLSQQSATLRCLGLLHGLESSTATRQHCGLGKFFHLSKPSVFSFEKVGQERLTYGLVTRSMRGRGLAQGLLHCTAQQMGLSFVLRKEERGAGRPLAGNAAGDHRLQLCFVANFFWRP